jgi:integrase
VPPDTSFLMRLSSGCGLQPSGHKSWAARYRVGRRTRKYTIGPFPRVGLKEARDKARAALESVAAGADPAEAKIAGRSPDASVEYHIGLYREQHVATKLRPGTAAYVNRILDDMAEAWKGRALASIKRADVLALRGAAFKRGPTAATTTAKRVSAFLQWCIEERGAIEINPAGSIKRAKNDDARDRTLDDAELVAVWRGCPDNRYGKFVRLLILTGCRRAELGKLAPSEVGADEIVIPKERIKNGVALHIPITAPMRAILDTLSKDHPFVWGKFGIPNDDRARDAVTAHIPHWTLHDLRRSFRTGLGRIGVAPHIAERCVNHRVGGMMAVYDRYSYGPEVRAAFEKWSGHVADIVKGSEARRRRDLAAGLHSSGAPYHERAGNPRGSLVNFNAIRAAAAKVTVRQGEA